MGLILQSVGIMLCGLDGAQLVWVYRLWNIAPALRWSENALASYHILFDDIRLGRKSMIRRLALTLAACTALSAPTYAFQTGDIVTYSDGTGAHVQTNTTVASPVFNNAQMNEYAASLLNGIVPGTEFSVLQGGNHATDALTGAVAVPSSATVYQSNAIAGYASASSTTTNTVAGYFQARALAGTTKIWALNTVASDGGFAVTNAGVELDTNCTNASSTCNGLTVIGASTAQFTGNGIAVSSPSVQSIGAVKWSNGFVVGNGAASVGFLMGATQDSPAGNIGSEPMDFLYYNGIGVLKAYAVAVNTGQALGITTSAGSGQAVLNVDGLVTMPQAGALFLGTDQDVASTGAGLVQFASGNTLTAVSIGNSSATLTLNVANGGTATKYVCVDASVKVVIQSGAC